MLSLCKDERVTEMEVYVLINKKKGIGVYILDSLVLVLLVAALLLSCLHV